MEEEAAERRAKVFLGGWRDTRTGLVYWNASTQTGNTVERRNDRITQTVRRADKCTNVGRDKAVQVHSMPDIADRSVRPRQWVPEPEYSAPDKKILESVLKIQRFYRSWRARTTLTRFQEVSVDRKTDTDQETIPGADTYRSTDFVILNRRTPRTKRDFELLYNLLDRWRILETERAGCSFLEPSRTAHGGLILSKEVELLRAIDSMKTVAKLTGRERSYRKFLDRLSRPVLWRNSRGETILVDTLRVQQARDLRDLYLILSNDRLSLSKRVEVLNELRDLLWEHTCGNSFQVIYLVDQELDLLSRGVQEARLNWLRNRLKLAFLKLARDSLATVAEEEEEEEDSVPKKLCKYCGKLLSAERFSHGSDVSLGCNQCVCLRPRTGPRIVFEPYARMLRELRRSEARMGACTSPAFIVDAELVYHLVNDIWHGRSAITEIDNFDELRLIRFQNRVEWSPWNSLLLTEKEASVHRALADPDQFYGQFLLQKFRAKNLQAKIRFGPILGLS